MSYDLISQLEFEAQAVNLQVIRNSLRQIFSEARTDVAMAEAMVIALNEACMNIIQHAYAAKNPRVSPANHAEQHTTQKILIIIEKNTQQWRFELIDFAPPVDIQNIKARELDDIRPGGLGVHFIQQIMDSVEYQNSNTEQKTGNRLILIKNINKSND